MARREIKDFDENPEQEPLDNPKQETKRELETKKLKEQIKSLELKNKILEGDIPAQETKITPTKNKGGAPERYSEEFHPKLAMLFYSRGGIDKEFCEYIGITEPTLHNWKKRHIEFREAIKKGKLDPDLKVEAALYSSAINDGSNTAQIFWLKNRMPSRWRDKQELELSGEIKNGGFQIVDKDGNEVSQQTLTPDK
jgi:transposase-like protein